MKKLYPDAIDVSQSVANRAVRIIEKHLRLAQVERARDLSEESRVRLYRDLRAFLDTESGGNGQSLSKGQREGLWARFLKRIEEFLSFSESSTGVYAPLAICPCVVYCDGFRQQFVSVTRAEDLNKRSGRSETD
ncbi:MAG: hypothetical protein Q7T82_08835 [Armatimonadota bacterium]|nr:hypothetical protein [Armatimonadota bacterium]